MLLFLGVFPGQKKVLYFMKFTRDKWVRASCRRDVMGLIPMGTISNSPTTQFRKTVNSSFAGLKIVLTHSNHSNSGQ